MGKREKSFLKMHTFRYRIGTRGWILCTSFSKTINNAEKVFLHGIIICGNGMKYDYMNMEENLIYLGVMALLQ